MVPAHEHVAVHLAFAEERALVRAAALIGAESALGPYDHDIETVRRECEGAVACEVVYATETLPARLLDLSGERACPRCRQWEHVDLTRVR